MSAVSWGQSGAFPGFWLYDRFALWPGYPAPELEDNSVEIDASLPGPLNGAWTVTPPVLPQ